MTSPCEPLWKIHGLLPLQAIMSTSKNTLFHTGASVMVNDKQTAKTTSSGWQHFGIGKYINTVFQLHQKSWTDLVCYMQAYVFLVKYAVRPVRKTKIVWILSSVKRGNNGSFKVGSTSNLRSFVFFVIFFSFFYLTIFLLSCENLYLITVIVQGGLGVVTLSYRICFRVPSANCRVVCAK